MEFENSQTIERFSFANRHGNSYFALARGSDKYTYEIIQALSILVIKP